MTHRAAEGDLSGTDQQPAEVGGQTFDREQELSVLETLEGEMNEVEAALDRLEDGSYGRCETCGRPIDDQRLDAQPASRYCLEHEPGPTAPVHRDGRA